ncbi:MAG: pentapeptide repeat-containing protein [Jaaginema sp. PMC 1079.18]|nr:pentapeptide repeat-containing protein [Jaaginema sp. PMC 1080.18]MEC4851711.1 pentapeptide repeat-containing protein [Jaaginema sp. PMC 1079.18]MEC4868407.1 pentapeptide repeat-containing protein [Jaaginema sp. PMC 1078.18]
MSLSIRQWLVERQVDLKTLLTPREVSGVAFRMIQDMASKSLTPFDICAIADVLELPLRSALALIQPIAQLTIGILRLLSRQKPLKRSEGTWLTFQVAYLIALQEILEQEAHLRRPWLNRASIPVSIEVDRPFNDAKLQGLLKTLRPGRLSDSQAEQALLLIGDSFLIQQMNNLAIAWLEVNGAEAIEAQLLTQRLVNGLPGHLLAVIAENAIPLAQLQKFVGLGNLRNASTLTTHTTSTNEAEEGEIAIDRPRELYRSQLLTALSQPLLGATFSLKDIYIPLKGLPIEDFLSGVEEGGNEAQTLPAPPTQPQDLQQWFLDHLEDEQSIIAIEAESGGGKTSFCKMLAAYGAQHLYPAWMPIFIELRHVQLQPTFEQTLESSFPQGRFSDADGWLSSQLPPLLLILDGLDELPPSPYKLRHYFAFIDQLVQFQAQCLSQTPTLRHKIVLTGRSRTFDGLTRRYRVGSVFPLQTKLRRILIQPLDREALQQWFTQWSKLQSKSISVRYFSFLKDEGVFRRNTSLAISALVHQPLMLYLLGLLHRDGLLDKSMLALSLEELKFEIYERIERWLLGETQGRKLLPESAREGMAHANRSTEAIANLLAGRAPEATRDLMEALALQILQAGTWQIPYPASDSNPTSPIAPLGALFFTPESVPPQSRQSEAQMSHIGLSHISLGSYLAAVAIAKRLLDLTAQVQDRYGEVSYRLDSNLAVAQHLYTLLGYGVMSLEMEQLAVEYLRRRQQHTPQTFSLKALFQRLFSFWRSYNQGRWLDEGVAHHSYEKLKKLNNSYNVAQIDAATGLNTFLLLCRLARIANTPFYPCGDPNHPQEFDSDRFATFISRIAVLSPTCFYSRVREHLSQLQLPGASLNQAMLPEVNFFKVNLAIAELNRADLVSANLAQANLSWASLAAANLQHSNLAQANLEGADLSGANLLGANLNAANLSNTCLYQAQLDPENRALAARSGAFFAWEEFQTYSQSLSPNLPFSDFPDATFFDTDSRVQIEIAEGEPILARDVWDDDPNAVNIAEVETEDETLAAYPHNTASPAAQRNEDETETLTGTSSPPSTSDDDETWVAESYPS